MPPMYFSSEHDDRRDTQALSEYDMGEHTSPMPIEEDILIGYLDVTLPDGRKESKRSVWKPGGVSLMTS